jgi:hypothetical protein
VFGASTSTALRAEYECEYDGGRRGSWGHSPHRRARCSGLDEAVDDVAFNVGKAVVASAVAVGEVFVV